jgi:lipid-binding SYLF domain-containing protein
MRQVTVNVRRTAGLAFGPLVLILQAALLFGSVARADSYDDTIRLFKGAGESATYFDKCFGYAVFPTIGKGGFVVGGAHGEGRVYRAGKYVGDSSMTQVSVGLQLGGEAYRQIIFFEDQRAFDDFTRGNFEFGADANAVMITAAASASAGTAGAAAGASGGQHDARTAGSYHNGMAVFTIAKGGAMYQATLGGQKFSYKPRPAP